MAIAETCPVCCRTDLEHECVRLEHRCRDPWHGDAHLRRGHITIDKDAISAREAKARTATTERAEQPTAIRMRAETSRRCFEDMLQHFVGRYAPVHPLNRDEFQRDLMMLMRDAMQHQSGVFSMQMERTESTMYALVNASTAPLNVIFKEKP